MTPTIPRPVRALPSLLADGTYTSVPGVRCGIARGRIKASRDRDDVVVLVAPGVAAAVTTRSTAAAAPCAWTRARVPGPNVAVVVNSGNANASTGRQGEADSAATAAAVAETLGCSPDAVLVCSTGVIGVPMPMDRMLPAARAAAADLGTDGHRAARAILTTDLVAKEAAVRVELGEGRQFTVGGFAKGSGMIHPNMGTMLGFVATDAGVEAEALQRLVAAVSDRTFNQVTVDGCTSTNDTLIVQATGTGPKVEEGSPEWALLDGALTAVCEHLAIAIARDGEGATRLLEVMVIGGGSEATARRLARAVAESHLFKAAVHGGDPNWGRIVGALGHHGAEGLDQLDLDVGDVPVLRAGQPIDWDEASAAAAMRAEVVRITARLPGEGFGFAWGCDLSNDYVKINADYRS
jgi:glutamate N-acetyltransferase/amino-acid N-acetyltransferase